MLRYQIHYQCFPHMEENEIHSDFYLDFFLNILIAALDSL